MEKASSSHDATEAEANHDKQVQPERQKEIPAALNSDDHQLIAIPASEQPDVEGKGKATRLSIHSDVASEDVADGFREEAHDPKTENAE
ncbi:hypothetical protein NLG97_g7222 [Lecanicillium saksenae]|uniref:Uncharacterized protein n=1 Tax=Lecanicillium saksenae TaxID=468837 RepID=A0ACC1QP35_9HYPO|nr:hypothetical protein NLG97_g7222 [Lecanicillium saksenae]